MGSPPSNPAITCSQVEGEIWSCKAVGHCCVCSLVSEMDLPCVYPAYRPPAHRGPDHHYGSHLDPSHHPPGWSWWWPSSNSAILHQWVWGPSCLTTQVTIWSVMVGLSIPFLNRFFLLPSAYLLTQMQPVVPTNWPREQHPLIAIQYWVEIDRVRVNIDHLGLSAGLWHIQGILHLSTKSPKHYL